MSRSMTQSSTKTTPKTTPNLTPDSHQQQQLPPVDRSRVTRRLIELCGIAGPSGDEGRVADYLVQFAREREAQGLSWQYLPVTSDPPVKGRSANILMRVPGSHPGEQAQHPAPQHPAQGHSGPILLSAHMDTVPLPSDEPPVISLSPDGVLSAEGDTILGGDDRAGIAAALEMIDLSLAASQAGLCPARPALEVLFTVEEELGCLGSRTLAPGMLTAAYGYNLDGETPPGTAIVRAPEKLRYSCTVQGRSAHAALAPQDGVNAIVIAAAIVAQLPQGQVDAGTTANVGSIRGGGQTNIVPDLVEIVGEIRSFSTATCTALRDDVDTQARRIAEELGGAAAVVWEHVYPGYEVDPSGRCLTRFKEACNSVGVECRLLASAGGGDANNLNALGMETVVFGLGMHKIHTPEEYLVLEEFLQAVELLRVLLVP